MARMAKGLMGTLEVTGRESAALMHAGPAFEDNRGDSSSNRQYPHGGEKAR